MTLKIWNTKLNWAMSATKPPKHDDQKLKSKVLKQESQKKSDRNGCDTKGKKNKLITIKIHREKKRLK